LAQQARSSFHSFSPGKMPVATLGETMAPCPFPSHRAACRLGVQGPPETGRKNFFSPRQSTFEHENKGFS
jgi:hypothetical protein